MLDLYSFYVVYCNVMKIAIIKLKHRLIVKINIKTNPYKIEGLISKFWSPPTRVIEFWNNGCVIEYRGEKDYLEQEKLIQKHLTDTIETL